MIYKDLIVWQKSMSLVKDIYLAIKHFPTEERFGLNSQIRRAAVSIPANIAEGHGRKSTQAYINHLSIAFGSLMELETLIQIAAKLSYLPFDKTAIFANKTDEIGKMLSGLKNALKKKLK